MMQTYITKKCIQCGETGTMELDMADVIAWHAGKLAQSAFPYLTVDLREQVISGTHPACWKAIFSDDD